MTADITYITVGELGSEGDVLDILLFGVPSAATTAPDPASLALLGLGLAGLDFNRRRKRKEAAT